MGFFLRAPIERKVCDLDVGLGYPERCSRLRGPVCSTVKILHDLSSDRRKPGQFLSSIEVLVLVRKDHSKVTLCFLKKTYKADLTSSQKKKEKKKKKVLALIPLL